MKKLVKFINEEKLCTETIVMVMERSDCFNAQIKTKS